MNARTLAGAALPSRATLRDTLAKSLLLIIKHTRFAHFEDYTYPAKSDTNLHQSQDKPFLAIEQNSH